MFIFFHLTNSVNTIGLCMYVFTEMKYLIFHTLSMSAGRKTIRKITNRRCLNLIKLSIQLSNTLLHFNSWRSFFENTKNALQITKYNIPRCKYVFIMQLCHLKSLTLSKKPAYLPQEHWSRREWARGRKLRGTLPVFLRLVQREKNRAWNEWTAELYLAVTSTVVLHCYSLSDIVEFILKLNAGANKKRREMKFTIKFI